MNEILQYLIPPLPTLSLTDEQIHILKPVQEYKNAQTSETAKLFLNSKRYEYWAKQNKKPKLEHILPAFQNKWLYVCYALGSYPTKILNIFEDNEIEITRFFLQLLLETAINSNSNVQPKNLEVQQFAKKLGLKVDVQSFFDPTFKNPSNPCRKSGVSIAWNLLSELIKKQIENPIPHDPHQQRIPVTINYNQKSLTLYIPPDFNPDNYLLYPNQYFSKQEICNSVKEYLNYLANLSKEEKGIGSIKPVPPMRAFLTWARKHPLFKNNNELILTEQHLLKFLDHQNTDWRSFLQTLNNPTKNDDLEGYIYCLKCTYLIDEEKVTLYKIGRTGKNNLKQRLNTHKTSNPGIVVMAYRKVDHVKAEEQAVHQHLKKWRFDSENDRSEWYKLNPDELKYLEQVFNRDFSVPCGCIFDKNTEKPMYVKHWHDQPQRRTKPKPARLRQIKKQQKTLVKKLRHQ